jgi:hypothetical protein
MSDEPSLSLFYPGDATPGSMEAKELLQLLTAFTRITNKASRTCYGTTSRISVRIERVQPGSVDLQWLHEMAAAAQSTFAALPALALGVKDIHGLIKAWLDLLKFLQGKPPQKVQHISNGNALQMENASGQTHIINGNVYNTFIINDIGSDAEKLQLPINRGAKKLELKRGHRKIATYTPDDLSNFKKIRPIDKPLESEIDVILEVVAPVLEGEGLWRFKYGRMSLTAKLADDEFRQKVIDGDESFRHGDRLRARLKTVQESVGNKTVTKHFVTKVVQRPR